MIKGKFLGVTAAVMLGLSGIVSGQGVSLVTPSHAAPNDKVQEVCNWINGIKQCTSIHFTPLDPVVNPDPKKPPIGQVLCQAYDKNGACLGVAVRPLPPGIDPTMFPKLQPKINPKIVVHPPMPTPKMP
jgi:hypothetical protein